MPQTEKARRFPIMDGPSIPWSVIEPHEAWAQRNHHQSLNRLAERGGLSPGEFYHVAKGIPLRQYERERSEAAGLALIEEILREENEQTRQIAILRTENERQAAKLETAYRENQQERNIYKRSLLTMQVDIESLRTDLTRVTKERDELRERIATLEAQLGEAVKTGRAILAQWGREAGAHWRIRYFDTQLANLEQQSAASPTGTAQAVVDDDSPL